MKQFFLAGLCSLIFCSLIFSLGTSLFAEGLTPDQIKAEWKAGRTLPASVFNDYQLPSQRRLPNDTGINVLIDLNRVCSLPTLTWDPAEMSIFHR
jgi:hypothetical protein